MNFTLSENDIKIVVAYGVLALHTLQASANKDMKLKDLDSKDFADEIKVTCNIRTIIDALEKSRELTQEK